VIGDHGITQAGTRHVDDFVHRGCTGGALRQSLINHRLILRPDIIHPLPDSGSGQGTHRCAQYGAGCGVSLRVSDCGAHSRTGQPA
jgi:hypothetical protein